MSKNFSRSFSCSRSHKIYIRSNKIKLGPTYAYHALWPLSYDLDKIQDRDKSANRCNGGIRSGAIFEHVQRSPPTFPTMPLHCRSLPISLRSLPFNSHLIPIGSDFQIGLDRQRIVAQWNGGIKLFVHAAAELEIKDTIRTVFNDLSAQHCSDVIMSTMASQITGDGLLNRLFRRISKKTSTHRVTGLCERNSPVRWIPLTKGQ